MTNAEQDLSRLLQEGFEALNRGQLDIAAQACQNALTQRPDLAPAHFLVGLVAVEGDERRARRYELGLSSPLMQKRRH